MSLVRCLVLSAASLASPILLDAQDEVLGNLSISANIGFESEYIFRGVKQGGESLQPSVDALHPLGSGDLYLGFWASQDLSGSPSDEVDFYAGYTFPLSPIFAISGGFTYYWFPDDGSIPGSEEEPYFGIFADLPLRPSLFAYYNIALEQILLELSLREDFQVSENSFIEGGVALGIGRADDSNSDELEGKPSVNFGYGKVYVDLVYELNQMSSVSIGVRYSGRQESSYTDYLYWGASVALGF
tara:strand:+ start:457 stop:1185 length:729 start_codon:yes stop_codon:yes gene_type:complete